MPKPTPALLLVVLAAACADATSGLPPGTRNVLLRTVADGVSGNALIVEESGGTSTVWVTLLGLTPNTTYTGSLDHGSCDNPGGEAIPLTRTSTSTAIGSAVSRNVPDSLLQAGYHIVYRGQGSPPPPVACGDLD